MSTIIGFLAEINGVKHRAALFKHTGTEVFWWSWMDAISGPMFHLDLTTGKGYAFSKVQDFHGSYHRDGRRHDRVVGKDSPASLLIRQLDPLAQIRGWRSLKSFTVPLDQPFGWELTQGPWKELNRSVVLRSENFGACCGLTLHGFVCRADSVKELVARWKLKHWVVGLGHIKIVVLAEPSKMRIAKS